MVIKTLVENTAVSKDFAFEHGLSFYIEMGNHKILFDVGASELFLQNAKKLNVDISDVDIVVISHGHYDHGGGLETFLKENTKAKVFIHPLAFGKHYALRPQEKLDFIGIDKKLKGNEQIILTSDKFLVGEGVQLFSNIMQIEPLPKSNGGLFKEDNGKMIADNFAHEQILVMEENGKSVLITGCAHNGIINILNHFHMIKGKMPDYVIGGFHLSSRSGWEEDYSTVDRISQYLMDTKAKFYTCHCTGVATYERMKSFMGDKIDYLPTGGMITL